MPTKPIAIDLFAGCGGLSLGLRRAGFDVRVAVEIDATAATTYRANHPDVTLLQQNICDVSSGMLLSRCNGPVALVAGCAPCQGFCSLTSKNAKEDPRNRLVLEMIRLIEGVRPKAVMMENVPGLTQRGSKIFKQFLSKLKLLGYIPEWQVVQMADYGVPQSRRRLVVLAGLGFRIPFPRRTHQKKAMEGRVWKTLRDVIGSMPTPVTLSEASANGGPRKFRWHVVRNIQEQTRTRLKAATPGKTWLTTDAKIRPKCHQGDYDGFTNVYGRMAWDQTPVTMTGGCTTSCKGRFGHPDKRRTTISVREAALIQTFPKSYRFETDYMDMVCDMIGNAVPPHFATKAGKQITRSLQLSREWPRNPKQSTSFGKLSRSDLMSRIRSRGNRTTEMRLADLLRAHRLVGWRRHGSLIGKPDFVWSTAKLAVFVDGCFWHGHDCGKNITPTRNALHWHRKIEGNKNRDQRVTRQLRRNGWTVIRIWECSLARKPDQAIARIQRILVAASTRKQKPKS